MGERLVWPIAFKALPRVVDLMCEEHREVVLSTLRWPIWYLPGRHGHRELLQCAACAAIGDCVITAPLPMWLGAVSAAATVVAGMVYGAEPEWVRLERQQMRFLDGVRTVYTGTGTRQMFPCPAPALGAHERLVVHWAGQVTCLDRVTFGRTVTDPEVAALVIDVLAAGRTDLRQILDEQDDEDRVGAARECAQVLAGMVRPAVNWVALALLQSRGYALSGLKVSAAVANAGFSPRRLARLRRRLRFFDPDWRPCGSGVWGRVGRALS